MHVDECPCQSWNDLATISRLAQACKKNRRAESTSGLARAMFYGYESKYVACKSKLILLLASTIVSLSAAAPASAATFALPSAASETSAAAIPILLARDVAEPLPGALERHKARTALIPPMKVDNCRCDDPLGTLEPATLHVVEFLAAFFGICGLVLYQLGERACNQDYSKRYIAIMKRLTSGAFESGGLTGHPTHTAYWPPTLHKI
ncbi:hypothetical protein GGD62_008136 [Bradyrhizobium sp. ERR14]|nr:hypothetical protein [Bradyrhizobium sp. ERR14]